WLICEEAGAETAGHVEELSERDLVPVGHARHPLGDVVVEGHLPLSHQLKDEGDREKLGLAADLELHVDGQRRTGGEVGDSGCADEGSLWAPDADEGTGWVIRVLELP